MQRTAQMPKCGRFLTEARARHGLSQKEIAARAGMTQANVSRIERDKVSPSLSTLNRILEAIGETLTIGSTPLTGPPPGGGNVSVRDLRADFDRSTPEQRIEQAALLSHTASELAASRGPA
ncbi:MAG: helix-turn-helix domain-containing protein [Solirubrobacterales bacterium]